MTSNSKYCGHCATTLPSTRFHVCRRNKDGLSSHCNACRLKRYPYQPKAHKIVHIRHRYGLEWEQYLDMYESQDKKCAICKSSLELLDGSTCVDHCHTTGKIRGLLCNLCNRGLGQFKERLDLLKEAVKYVEFHS